jgi:hypothetical protein
VDGGELIAGGSGQAEPRSACLARWLDDSGRERRRGLSVNGGDEVAAIQDDYGISIIEATRSFIESALSEPQRGCGIHSSRTGSPR